MYNETRHLLFECGEVVVYGCEASRAPAGWRDVLGSGHGGGKRQGRLRGLVHKAGNGQTGKGGKRGRWGELKEGKGGKRRGVMTPEQRAGVKSVKVFAQQFWLEDWSGRGMWGDFCGGWDCWGEEMVEGGGGVKEGQGQGQERGGLESLRVTIRHTDWWYYLLGASRSPLELDPRKPGRRAGRLDHYSGNGGANADDGGDDDGQGNSGNGIQNMYREPIHQHPDSSSQQQHQQPSDQQQRRRRRPGWDFENGSWGSKLAHLPPSLKTFELELETTTNNTAALEAIATFAAPKWRFPLAHGTRVLIFDPDATERYQWTGSATFKGSSEPGSVETVPASARGWGVESSQSGVPQQQQQQQQGRRRSMFGTLMDRTKSNGSGRTGSVVSDGSESRQYPTLDYHVVTLRFRAMRPEDAPPLEGIDDAAADETAENGGDVVGNGSSSTAPAPTANGHAVAPAHAMADARPARQVARDVVPSYWG